MEIAPLGAGDIDELTAFARQTEVARFGEHLETDPRAMWQGWLGEADPHRRITLAARHRGELRCAARLSTGLHRRRIHVGGIDVIAPWHGDDQAIDAALEALVDTADRWMQIARLELLAPMGHPRVETVYRNHGFEVETKLRGTLLRDGDPADEVGLGRVRPGVELTRTPKGPPVPPPRRPPPSSIVFRPVRPDDAPGWTAALSSEPVVWGTLQLPWQRVEAWSKRLRENDPKRLFSVGAEVDGELVGAGVLMVSPIFRRRHVARVGMHVNPEHQGRGIGGRLMRELLALGQRLGFHRLDLEVFPDNPRAVQLYESTGFAHEGRRRASCFREGELVDDLVMARVG